MLESVIQSALQGEISCMNIYRHFKGGYYIVQSVATIESSGEQVVVYQSLQDGKVWVRPLSAFNEPVPKGKSNPTGQTLRFERLKSFENQLSLINTDSLVSELESRNDNPFAGLMSVSNKSKVWREDYMVGKYVDRFIDRETTVRDFDIETCYLTMEEAVGRIRKLNRSDFTIVKKVFMDVDF